jgi:hypothetical protein
MRFREIRGGLQLPVSSLEQELIEHIQTSEGLVEATQLDEFQSELARKMVSKGLLNQVRQDGSLYFVVNELEEIWRE